MGRRSSAVGQGHRNASSPDSDVYPSPDPSAAEAEEEEGESWADDDDLLAIPAYDEAAEKAADPMFPSPHTFNLMVQDYLANLSVKKREKALLTQKMYESVLQVLKDPKDTSQKTAQFRFWVKKMFQLTTFSGDRVVCHDHKPVAVKEHIYEVLVHCHAQAGHGGRDKTSTQVGAGFFSLFYIMLRGVTLHGRADIRSANSTPGSLKRSSLDSSVIALSACRVGPHSTRAKATCPTARRSSCTSTHHHSCLSGADIRSLQGQEKSITSGKPVSLAQARGLAAALGHKPHRRSSVRSITTGNRGRSHLDEAQLVHYNDNSDPISSSTSAAFPNAGPSISRATSVSGAEYTAAQRYAGAVPATRRAQLFDPSYQPVATINPEAEVFRKGSDGGMRLPASFPTWDDGKPLLPRSRLDEPPRRARENPIPEDQFNAAVNLGGIDVIQHEHDQGHSDQGHGHYYDLNGPVMTNDLVVTYSHPTDQQQPSVLASQAQPYEGDNLNHPQYTYYPEQQLELDSHQKPLDPWESGPSMHHQIPAQMARHGSFLSQQSHNEGYADYGHPLSRIHFTDPFAEHHRIPAHQQQQHGESSQMGYTTSFESTISSESAESTQVYDHSQVHSHSHLDMDMVRRDSAYSFSNGDADTGAQPMTLTDSYDSRGSPCNVGPLEGGYQMSRDHSQIHLEVNAHTDPSIIDYRYSGNGYDYDHLYPTDAQLQQQQLDTHVIDPLWRSHSAVPETGSGPTVTGWPGQEALSVTATATTGAQTAATGSGSALNAYDDTDAATYNIFAAAAMAGMTQEQLDMMGSQGLDEAVLARMDYHANGHAHYPNDHHHRPPPSQLGTDATTASALLASPTPASNTASPTTAPAAWWSSATWYASAT